jgi:hypothetical protein
MTDQNSNASEPPYAAKFPKTSKKPESGWKSSLSYGVSTSPKKPKRKIAPFGKRTKERIAKYGTESEFFIKEIWDKRPHVCEQCGKRLREPKPHNFDHIIAKSRDASKRYDPNNIRLLCFAHHFFKTTAQVYK